MSEVVIVAGSAGFLGYHLAAHYLNKGYSVIGLDNLLTGSSKNIHDLQENPNFTFIRHSVEDDWYPIEQLLRLKNHNTVKYVFHFASIAEPTKFQTHYPEIMKANSTGTINAVELANKYKARVIYASSSEIYGTSSKSILSEVDLGEVNSTGARSCYNESKRFSESYLSHTNRVYKTKHGIVRIFNTYGPRMNPNDTRVVVAMINWALRNQDIEIYGESRTRSFCFVDDLIRGITQYAATDITEPMNLGNEQETPITELAKQIITLSRSKSKVVIKEPRSDEPAKRRPALDFAKQSLQYKTSVDLESGLWKTIEYLRKNVSTGLNSLGTKTKINLRQGTDQIR